MAALTSAAALAPNRVLTWAAQMSKKSSAFCQGSCGDALSDARIVPRAAAAFLFDFSFSACALKRSRNVPPEPSISAILGLRKLQALQHSSINMN